MVFMEINLNIVWSCESSAEVATQSSKPDSNKKEEQQVTFGYTCLWRREHTHPYTSLYKQDLRPEAKPASRRAHCSFCQHPAVLLSCLCLLGDGLQDCFPENWSCKESKQSRRELELVSSAPNTHCPQHLLDPLLTATGQQHWGRRKKAVYSLDRNQPKTPNVTFETKEANPKQEKQIEKYPTRLILLTIQL